MQEAFDSFVQIRGDSRGSWSFLGFEASPVCVRSHTGDRLQAADAELGEQDVVRAYLESKRPRGM